MKKNIILTFCDESLWQYFDDTSFYLFRKYSEITNSDFLIYGGNENENYKQYKETNNPIYLYRWNLDGRHTFVKNLLKNYEKVLYLDADILINIKITPNIFDISPSDVVSVYNSGCDIDCEITLRQTLHYFDIFNEVQKKYNKPALDIEDWKLNDRKYFNNGVCVIPSGVEFFLDDPDEYVLTDFGVQDYFNYILRINNIKVNCLGKEWNSSIRDYPVKTSHDAEIMENWDIRNVKQFNTEHYFLHFLAIGGNDYRKRHDIMKKYMENLINLGGVCL